MAAAFFQEGTALNITPQTTPMPTLDRLAEPTLPASPSQADHGAQIYWLNCMPCHGDVGQGLTDEFRDTYPPEDNNCWARGCHGKNPYEGGFTLPTSVPRLIGPGALTKFSSVANLHTFIQAAMPFEDPGVLTENEYWQVTAFLLRENRIPYTGQLNASTANQIRFPWVQMQPTPILLSTPVPSAPLTVTPNPSLVTPGPQPANPGNWILFLLIFLLGGILFLWHTLRRK